MKKIFLRSFFLCLGVFLTLLPLSASDAPSNSVGPSGIPIKDGFTIKYGKLPKNVVFTTEIPVSKEFSATVASCPDDLSVLSYDADKLRVKLSNTSGGVFELFRVTSKIKIKPVAEGKATVVLRSKDKTIRFVVECTETDNDGKD